MNDILNFNSVLLPRKDIDLHKWAVIACDQFTSTPKYWRQVEELIKGAYSTGHITFPEIYLSADNSPRIESINREMRRYLDDGIFAEHKNCAVVTRRGTKYNKQRLGLVLSVDLEQYSWVEADRALIRASEGTILSRIPPRVKIRENAPIELPHIMLLIDDRERTVIEPLYEKIKAAAPLYDFDLNMDGGHVTGWKTTGTAAIGDALQALLKPETLLKKYGSADRLLFAVGDGNHSLATAKAVWQNLKQTLNEAQRKAHPARYALVEVVNIYDEGLKFEPIHRVVFGIDKAKFMKNLPQITSDAVGSIARAQAYIDAYIAENGGEVDYIHGEGEVESIVKENEKRGAAGIIMPRMKKEEFFNYIINKGTLPRKTFSMGEGIEKRYYLEARKIK